MRDHQLVTAANVEGRAFSTGRRTFVGGLLAACMTSSMGTHARAAGPAAARPLIVLDPGHGGHDPGAIGVTGLYEKHLALAVAKDLQAALTAGGRHEVMLTREHDIYIPLERRAAFARSRGASLFVSIHADALHDRSVRGASVYTLAGKASDLQSDELARRENGVDPTASGASGSYPPQVETILESLAAREDRVLSARLQSDVVSALAGGDILMLHNPSRRANFVVLRGDLPSVLVEMGFMSNRADERLLAKPAHRARVVAALQSGLERCMATFARMPVAG